MSNAIAPEHLQLMVPEDDGLALLGLVQNAGAVFIGPWSPASMGDYIAGPNHVLPTNRTARFASALRADDFRKHVHAVRVSPDALRALGPARRHPGRDRGPAGPRRLGTASPRRARRALEARRPAQRTGRAMSAVPPVRPGPPADRGLPLATGRRRGAPQHQRVALRAARRLARGAARRPGRGLVPPLSRPAGHRAPAGRGRPARRHAGRGVLRQRLERGAAEPAPRLRRARAGAPWCSSRPMRCTRTSRGSPAPRSSRARATTTS